MIISSDPPSTSTLPPIPKLPILLPLPPHPARSYACVIFLLASAPQPQRRFRQMHCCEFCCGTFCTRTLRSESVGGSHPHPSTARIFVPCGQVDGPRILHTGFLVKQGKLFKSWRSRWFVLWEDGKLRSGRPHSSDTPSPSPLGPTPTQSNS